MRLEGKVVIVTGSSRGIGRAIAELFSAEGATVVVNCKDRIDAAQETVDAIGPERSLLVRADVAVEAEARHLVQETLDAFGRVDVLVNNAGTIIREPHWRSDRETLQATLDANLISAWLVTREVAPLMARAEAGAIVNVSSIYAVLGAASDLSYSMAKGGMNTMTRALAKELAPHIRVNAIAPGNVLTDMSDDAPSDMAARFARETPLRRSAQPAEIARAALFLASDDSSYVTGQILLVDGGYSLR